MVKEEVGTILNIIGKQLDSFKLLTCTYVHCFAQLPIWLWLKQNKRASATHCLARPLKGIQPIGTFFRAVPRLIRTATLFASVLLTPDTGSTVTLLEPYKGLLFMQGELGNMLLTKSLPPWAMLRTVKLPMQSHSGALDATLPQEPLLQLHLPPQEPSFL